MPVMSTHTAVVLEQPSEQPRREAERHDRPSPSSDRPSLSERICEAVPLISAPAFFGPPVIFVLGPWLLLVLLLVPPTAVLITLAIVALLGAGLLVALGAVIASPYLLMRHLRARHPIARQTPAASDVADRERPNERPVRTCPIQLTTR